MAESIRVAQGLVDMPPNLVHPITFKDFALEALKGVDGLKYDVIEGAELAERGYGLLYAVGQGSSSAKPPCLLVVTHPGAGDGQQGVALVGKGITFDTGGAALKPREGMCGMKRDMGGAAGCFGAFLAAAKAGGLPSGRPLHLVLCLAENAIGSRCFVQDDILVGYSGLTVEINNTDAEGRLVLSDGVAHVAKHLDCDLVVDMATLTGAQGISTGSHHATAVASDEALEDEIVSAGRASGDLVHPGIFAPELLLHEFDSKFADMKNSVKNRANAQSSCAGLFIYKHLKNCGYQGKWLHLDMAYPSFEPLGDYATGWGVGLLCKHLGIV
jgi:probable aminopeptidase NPEPL1